MIIPIDKEIRIRGTADCLKKAIQAVDKIAARYNKLLDDAIREAA